jgi:acetamidase/formamidase
MEHHFQPTTWHNTFGAHEPVLRVADGDTIVTVTLDARGYDAEGARAGQGPNPLTGPFFVEGARPGDALAVTVEQVTPNRATGWARAGLSPQVVDPGFIAEMAPAEMGEWCIDIARGLAQLTAPRTMLGRVALPLAPMLGCLGVAPGDGQAISTATSGRYGGNMDYCGVRTGATLYFPVSVEGALLFVGDGHAVQGDGEITGNGIEVSMAVRLCVRVVPGAAPGWPRGEDADWLFALGNARPLEQALQHATTEMARWLRDGYGLDDASVGVLLGQAVAYEIGNVYDPAYTVACKLAKKWCPAPACAAAGPGGALPPQ